MNQTQQSRLSKLTTAHGRYLTDPVSGQGVYDVTNQHVLVQASGYLKHVLGKEGPCGVFFRGQASLYPSLVPSLYRGASTQKQKDNRDAALKAYLAVANKAVLRAVKPYAREPLLQHYGIRTRWLDLVDNIWIALWFACHEARATGRHNEFLHFERRSAASASGATEYAYILMIQASTERTAKDCPGLFAGPTTELIDLRVAAPSHFLRPHSQHALLFRRSYRADFDHMDCLEHVAGIIRVRVSNALLWLGDGALLTPHALFPPPTYDFGYRELLAGAPPGNADVAAINLVGA